MKIYSIKEAAQKLGITPSEVYRLKDMGRIRVEKIGAQYTISEKEIERFKKAH